MCNLSHNAVTLKIKNLLSLYHNTQHSTVEYIWNFCCLSQNSHFQRPLYFPFTSTSRGFYLFKISMCPVLGKKINIHTSLSQCILIQIMLLENYKLLYILYWCLRDTVSYIWKSCILAYCIQWVKNSNVGSINSPMFSKRIICCI